MIIATIAEANLVSADCCPCSELPDCPAPKQECESITLYPCGWTLAELIFPEEFTDLPDSVIHYRYRTKTDRYTRSTSGIFEYDETDDSYATRDEEIENETVVSLTPSLYRAYLPFGPYCTEEFTTSNYQYESIKHFDADDTLLLENTTTFSSSSSSTAECSGTNTVFSADYTVTPADIVGPDTSPLNLCYRVEVNPDLDWTLSGTTLTETEVSTSEPPLTSATTEVSSVSLSDPVTVEFMKSVIDALEFPEPRLGGSCTSILELDPLSPTQPSLIRRARYRFTVPDGYTRSRWEMQWDVVFFPKEWEDWKALKTAYDAAVAEHTAWENADPETRGPEPVVPDDPGEEPSPKPSLVSEHSWSWAGEDWSDWYELPAPEEAGETRVVNLMVICWRSSKIGQKPTPHGEVYVFPEA